ncbi:MAG: hypothetical protein E3J83_05270 [Candidatus Atribacteria bacterium]|nr:MAG: hypothetical protein E3J83_05270 [Candidatus Atribacteria bacterium]
MKLTKIFSEDVVSYALYKCYVSKDSRVFFKISHNIDIKTGEHDRAAELGLTKKQFSFFKAIRSQLQGDKEEGYISQKDLYITKEITERATQLIKDKYVIDWTTNISKT